MERISHWIGGKVVPGESGRTGPVYDPATGAQTHEVDFATDEEVGQAVAAATDAFPAWRATSLSRRAEILFEIREQIEARRTELAQAITSQHGKVLSDAMGEVQRGLENVEFACGIPHLLKGGFTEQASTGVDVYSIRQPLGGAKNHMIVLPDADLDMAADAAVSAGYGSAGERCMAISAVVAVGGIADELVDKISDRLPKVKVGPGTDPESEMGPLVTGEHREKVAGYLDSGREQGATVVRDGREDPIAKADGFFLGVSLLDHVTEQMDAYRDEIFGPVLSVLRVDTYDDAVRLVNENPYGNGVAIFTRDGGAARQFQFDAGAGMVGINVPIPVPVAYYSFGGWKNSLFGDRHIYGPEGIEFYTRGKVVTSRWPDPATSKVDLGFPQTR